MLRRLLGAVAILGTTTVAQAQSVHDQVTTYSLDNGMDVVVIEDHRAPAVTHMVWYKVGSADEPPGVSGIAHYLEHLLFKGTDKLEPGEFSRIVSQNGGRDNAFTSFDYTGYFQTIAADRLELMMTMEADRMVNLNITQEDILTERDVVIEERNQRVENDPGSLFREQRSAAQYLNHPYGRPIIGWRHEMETLSLDDALSFYEAHYAPNNAILIVAGDVQPEDVLELAKEHYGVIPANPEITERERPQEPPQTSPRRMTFEDPRVAQPYVMRTYQAPERDPGAQTDAAALVMLAEVLGGGQTSYLNQKLEFQDKTSLYVSAFYSGTSYDDTTFGVVNLPAEGVSLAEAEAHLDAALVQFMQDGVDAELLERIKFNMRAQQIYAQDSLQGLARRYGVALTSGLTVEDVKAWPDILQAVTEEDILAAAEQVFDLNRSVTGWLMTPDMTADGAKEITQ